MKLKILYLFIIVFLITGCDALKYNLNYHPEKFSQEGISPDSTYRLIFIDNFNGNMRPEWKRSMFWSGPLYDARYPECGWYSFDNFTFTDSTVKIWVKDDPRIFGIDSVHYSIGVLDLWDWLNANDIDLQECVIEARIKLPLSDDTWPALWTYGVKEWQTEIDIMEAWTVRPDQFTTNFHCIEGPQQQRTHRIVTRETPTGYIGSSDFHIYSLKIDTAISYYFDGFKFRTIEKLNYLIDPFTIILQNGVYPTGGWSDSYMEVDWFKLYIPWKQ